jgi:hypothetical protein
VIEGVITGVIADWVLVAEEGVGRLVVKEEEDFQQLLWHRHMDKIARECSDRIGKWDDSCGSNGLSINVSEQRRDIVIALPSKGKSLFPVGLVFFPIGSKGTQDNYRGWGRKRGGGDKYNNTKVADSNSHLRGGNKRVPICQGTPRTTMASTSGSSRSCGSGFNLHHCHGNNNKMKTRMRMAVLAALCGWEKAHHHCQWQCNFVAWPDVVGRPSPPPHPSPCNHLLH